MIPNNHRPGFDRLIISVVTLIVICLAAVLVCGMTGCDSRAEPTGVSNSDRLIMPTERLSVVRVGRCEYIQFEYGYTVGFTHKGNCSNPIHCTCDTLR